LAWILGAYGFEPNVDQSKQALLGIRLVNSVYPAIFALLGMGIMLFYPLSKTMMAKVEADLIERRQQQDT
jgi:GPH family glycoside/pentoside/hexuronide:cation symporter